MEKLDSSVSNQFKKLKVSSKKLNNFDNFYKIKLYTAGYLLVYQIHDKEFIVIILVVGKREQNQVYKIANKRI